MSQPSPAERLTRMREDAGYVRGQFHECNHDLWEPEDAIWLLDVAEAALGVDREMAHYSHGWLHALHERLYGPEKVCSHE